VAKRLGQRKYEDRTIAKALSILERRIKTGSVYSSPEAVKSFLRLQTQGLQHEVFAVMYLDAQYRLIAYEQLFRGTLTHVTVYPREVVKQALLRNAALVILHHNHPSGRCLPSQSDRELTGHVREALNLVEVPVLDHVVTSDEGSFSMAQDCGRWTDG